MAKKVPFPFVQGVTDRSAFELERNFQYLADQFAVTATGWDAIVDPTIGADDTVNLQFKTVFAAVKYLADTKLLTDMTIGVRQTTTSVVETGNYGGSTSNLTVRVIGIGGGNGSTAVISNSLTTWDLHGFHENSKWRVLIIASLRVAKNDGAVTPDANFFQSASLNVHAMDTFFDGQGASSTTACPNIAGITANNCLLIDVTSSGASVLRDCEWWLNRPTSVTMNGTILWLGVGIRTPGANCNLTLGSTTNITIEGVVIQSTSSFITTLTIAAAKEVSIKLGAPAGNFSSISVNISSTVLQNLLLEGWFHEITTTAVITGQAVGIISAAVKLRADITGPAVVNLALHDGSALTTYGVRLRGAVSGSVQARVADSAAAATVFDFIAAKRCVLIASIKLDGAASTGTKAFNFDAASANNILILEADAVGGVSADAGANDLVITDGTFGSSPTQATVDADFSHDFMMGTL